MEPGTSPENPHASPAENARFAAFAASLEREGFSPITQACYASDWWTVSEHAHRATGRRFRLDRFGPDGFLLQRAALSARATAPATLNRRLAFLRRYSAFSAEREPALRETAAGFAAVPFQAVERRAAKALTPGQEQRLRDAADALGTQEAAVVAILLGTGLRASELAGLRRSDVSGPHDAPAGVRVRGPRAKTALLAVRSRMRLAAVLAAAEGRADDALFRRDDGAALGEDGVNAAVARAAREAGVDATPRTLRHTFGVRYLSEHRDDLEGLARALGQSSLAAARAYREEAEAGAPVVEVHRWSALEETAPSRGIRRRALASGRLAAERDVLAPGAELPSRAHREERLVFVLSGRVTVHTGRRRIEAGPGEIVIVPAGAVHRIVAGAERSALLLSVSSSARRGAAAGGP